MAVSEYDFIWLIPGVSLALTSILTRDCWIRWRTTERGTWLLAAGLLAIMVVLLVVTLVTVGTSKSVHVVVGTSRFVIGATASCLVSLAVCLGMRSLVIKTRERKR